VLGDRVRRLKAGRLRDHHGDREEEAGERPCDADRDAPQHAELARRKGGVALERRRPAHAVELDARMRPKAFPISAWPSSWITTDTMTMATQVASRAGFRSFEPSRSAIMMNHPAHEQGWIRA